MASCGCHLLVAEFLDLADDDGLLGCVDLLGALEGSGEGVAELHADGDGTVATACEEVGLILPQH